MTMTDAATENEDQPIAPVAPAAPAQVVIDESRFQQLLDTFSANNQRPATQAEKNYMGALVQGLKEKGLDDQFIDAQFLSAELVKQNIMSEVDKRVQMQVVNGAITGARNHIRASLRPYIKEEPRLGHLQELLESRVAQKFDSDRGRQQALFQGQWSADVIDKLVEEAVDDISKNVLGMDKPKNLGLNKSNAAAKAEVEKEKSGGGDGGGKANLDSLTDDQRDFYNARVTSLQYKLGKTPDEAKKLAFEQAKALPAQPVKARR